MNLVCVCTYHQNTKLFIEAMKADFKHKYLIAKTVFSIGNKECMIG